MVRGEGKEETEHVEGVLQGIRVKNTLLGTCILMCGVTDQVKF